MKLKTSKKKHRHTFYTHMSAYVKFQWVSINLKNRDEKNTYDPLLLSPSIALQGEYSMIPYK